MPFSSTGFGLIEIIAGTAIISVALVSLVTISQMSLSVSSETTSIVQASFLLEEGAEAIKILRDSGWGNIDSLSKGVPYYFEFSDSKWGTTTVNNYIDGKFERSFVVDGVWRDINDDISSSGVFDHNTNKISVYVSWSGRNGTTTKEIIFYVTNIFGS